MSWLLGVTLGNSFVVVVLACLVLLFSRVYRRPTLVHCLWVIVLLKLITPPLISLPLTFPGPARASTGTPDPEPSRATEDAPVAGPAAVGRQPEAAAPPPLPEPVVGELPITPAPSVVNAPSAGLDPRVLPLSLERVWAAAPWALLGVWLIGSLSVTSLVLFRLVSFHRLLRNAIPASEGLQEEASDLARQVGLARSPRVLLVSGVVSPMLWSWGGRPLILFPLALAARLDRPSRETLLLHELAHYARGDHWVRLLELVTFVLYWWHPVVWLARRELHAAEEDCCDAWVVAQAPDCRPVYARALLQTIDFLAEARPALPPVASGLGYFHELKHRLTRIMNDPASRGPSGPARIVAATVALLVLPLLPTLGTAVAEADDNPPEVARKAPETNPAPALVGLEPTEFDPAGVRFPLPVETAQCSAFSPDGRWLVTGYGRATEAGEVRIWDLKSFKEQLTFSEPIGVRSVAVSLDGKRLAYGNHAGAIRVRDLLSGKVEKEWQETAGTVESVTFSADGKWLVTGSGNKVARVWEVASGKLMQTFTGHTNRVYGVAILPEGATVVTGSQDKTVKFWERETGRMIRSLDHPGEVLSVARSPDGKRIVSACMDGSARVWDASDGKLQATLTGPAAAISASFSPSNDTLAVSHGDGSVRLWSLKSQELLGTLAAHQGVAHHVIFSADGKLLASSGWDRMVKLWDVGTRREKETLAAASPTEEPQPVLAVAWSPDRSTVASAHEDKLIRLRDATGAVRRVLKGHEDVVTSLAFSPDGRLLASAGFDGAVKLWDLRSPGEKTESKALAGHAKWVMSVAFSPDGKRLVSGSYDRTLRLWDVGTGKELEKLEGHRAAVRSVAFSSDGKLLASGGGDRTVRIWNAISIDGKREVHTLRSHEAAVRAVAFAPDGKTLASAGEDNTVKLWDLSDPKVADAEPRTLTGHRDIVMALVFSPRGGLLASGGLDRLIKLWDPKTGAERATLQGHQDAVTSLAFAPDTSALLSGSQDRTLRLWKSKGPGLPTLSALATISRQINALLSIALSPDGRWLAVGEKETTLYDLRTGRLTLTLGGQKSGTTQLAFSSDSGLLAVSTYSGAIKLWDMQAGRWLGDFEGHKGRVSRAVFSPDGKLLASVGKDQTIKVWDVGTRKVLATSPAQALALTDVAFSPDGKTLASSSGDWQQWQTPGEIKLWSVPELKELQTLGRHDEEIKGVAFLPGGGRLVSWSSSSRGTTRLWDLATGKEMGRFAGCHALALLPDGRRVAAGDMKGKLTLWDLEKQQPVLNFEGHKDMVYVLACSPDGSLLASSSRDGSVRLWPTGGRGEQTAAARVQAWKARP